MADVREVSVELLRTLTPLEGMKRENLHALAKKVTVKQMSAGRVLFKEGDADKRTLWIIGVGGNAAISRMIFVRIASAKCWRSRTGTMNEPSPPMTQFL